MTRLPCLMMLSLLVGGCARGAGHSRDGTGADAGARIGDPAVAAAINAPIMSDPGLSQSANANAVRPPPMPDPLSFPAEAQAAAR